jgi:pyruvate formate lyase activating enzyme
MLDIKADPEDPDEYRKVTGRAENSVHNSGSLDVLDQAEFLARQGKLYELRTVVSPGLFNPLGLVEKACRRLEGIDPNLQYKLIRYRPVGVRREAAAILKQPDDALMSSLAGICENHGIKPVTV